ncbi:putative S-adenosyl-L-methionine-dependent methyltransferase [Helianthus annuus]|nr:putative S-adenosyl-L-methionine-dependent methyltransferase [Helianthus annuus]
MTWLLPLLLEKLKICLKMIVLLLSKVDGPGTNLRRRLRFLKAPNIFQADCPLVAIDSNGMVIAGNLNALKAMPGQVVFSVDPKVLQPGHLMAMASGMRVVGSYLGEKFIAPNETLKALCLGVGAGILEQYLSNELGFDVTGVELDENLCAFIEEFFLSSASDQPGPWAGVNLLKGCGAMEEVAKFALNNNNHKRFDIITLDITDYDELPGVGACAPPRNFLDQDFFSNLRKILHDNGALIIHVMILDFRFHLLLLTLLKPFIKVYRVSLGKESEFVLAASMAGEVLSSDDEDRIEFSKKIKLMLPGAFNIQLESSRI